MFFIFRMRECIMCKNTGLYLIFMIPYFSQICKKAFYGTENEGAENGIFFKLILSVGGRCDEAEL